MACKWSPWHSLCSKLWEASLKWLDQRFFLFLFVLIYTTIKTAQVKRLGGQRDGWSSAAHQKTFEESAASSRNAASVSEQTFGGDTNLDYDLGQLCLSLMSHLQKNITNVHFDGLPNHFDLKCSPIWLCSFRDSPKSGLRLFFSYPLISVVQALNLDLPTLLGTPFLVLNDSGTTIEKCTPRVLPYDDNSGLFEGKEEPAGQSEQFLRGVQMRRCSGKKTKQLH